jgi:hypothetical protein
VLCGALFEQHLRRGLRRSQYGRLRRPPNIAQKSKEIRSVAFEALPLLRPYS